MNLYDKNIIADAKKNHIIGEINNDLITSNAFCQFGITSSHQTIGTNIIIIVTPNIAHIRE